MRYSLGHADLSIDATVADEELAALLQVEIGTPVLRVERLTHDANGQPIDYEYLYFQAIPSSTVYVFIVNHQIKIRNIQWKLNILSLILW